MFGTLTAETLFESLRERFALDWLAGKTGLHRELPLSDVLEHKPPDDHYALVGYLNFIRPSYIQIIGSQELEYLNSLGKNSHQDALAKLVSLQPVCVIIADGESPPESLIQLADGSATPLLGTQWASETLVDHLQYHLVTRMAQRKTMHGVFMEVMGIGVLLSGPSGVGKSELALELITRGHRLIADDAPEFSRLAPDTIMGSCPELLKDFLEVRGLGVLNVRAMFGDNALKQKEALRLIVQLQRMSDGEIFNMDRLHTSRQFQKILNVEIPHITLPVLLGSNLAVLVEGAVRNHLLTMKGYSATERFIARQKTIIDQGGT